MKAKSRILVIGSMNMDMVVKTVRIPKVGETLLGGTFGQYNGGKGANQAMAAKSLYSDTSFCAGVGDDSIGAEYMKYFRRKKLDTTLVKKFKGEHTGVAVIMVGGNGENSISVAPGANMSLKPADMKKIDFKKFAYAVFQLESPLATVAEALKLAKKAGCKTVLTPAPAQLLPDSMLKNIDYIVPNEHEILLLQEGFECPKKAANALLEKGVGAVIVTLGSKGCMTFTKDGEKTYGIYKVKVSDTTGAGDCFTGSLAAGLCMYGGNLEKAVRLATAAASLKVTKAGAQSYAPTKQVMALLKKPLVSK